MAAQKEVEVYVEKVRAVQIRSFFERYKGLIRELLLLATTDLSAASLLYAAQDAIRQYLTRVGRLPKDIDSVGMDIDSVGESNRAINGLALWAIPITTILINGFMRKVTAQKIFDFFMWLRAKGTFWDRLPVLVFAPPAVLTAIGDMVIGVLLSENLKNKWAPWAIYGESALTLLFLIPFNLYYMNLLYQQRLKCAGIKYYYGIDLKLQSNQFKAIACELQQVEPLGTETLIQAQERKFKELYEKAGLNGDDAPKNYSDLMAKSQDLDALKDEMKQVCEANHLRDGSSGYSTAMAFLTAFAALFGAAATTYSPDRFYKETAQFPDSAARAASIIAGGVKFTVYWGCMSDLMWRFTHWDSLGSAAKQILWGAATFIAALSAIGFLEVAETAENGYIPSLSENLPGLFWALAVTIYLSGAAANASGFLACLQRELQKWKQEAENAGRADLVKGLEELSEHVITAFKRPAAILDEEQRPLNAGDDEYGVFVPMHMMKNEKVTNEEGSTDSSGSEDDSQDKFPDVSGLINSGQPDPASNSIPSPSWRSCCSSFFQESRRHLSMPSCLKGLARPFQTVFN